MAKQRIRIKLKAYEHNVLDESAEKIVQIAQQTGAAISGPVPLPTRKSRYCVLRGPHVNKKARYLLRSFAKDHRAVDACRPARWCRY